VLPPDSCTVLHRTHQSGLVAVPWKFALNPGGKQMPEPTKPHAAYHPAATPSAGNEGNEGALILELLTLWIPGQGEAMR
jgi:hypothetical protein